MANCKIDRGSAFDCDDIAQGGIGDYVYLINKEDWDAAQTKTFDTGVTEELTALTLPVGAQGYKFESTKGSAQIIPSSPFRSVTAVNGYDHTVDIRILDISQLSRNNVEKLAHNKVVAIVPLLSGKFLVYGDKVGMRMSDFQENPGDADVGGTFQCVIKTPDTDPPEVKLPFVIASTFDITSLDTPAV